jgi:hypothetical protein
VGRGREARWPCAWSLLGALLGLLCSGLPALVEFGWQVGQWARPGRALGAWASLVAEHPVQGPLASRVKAAKLLPGILGCNRRAFTFYFLITQDNADLKQK